jgi:predicted GIY-YIG superfamily endonuclease
LQDRPDVTEGIPGVIYLIHFDRRVAHAGHYLGWTADLNKRLRDHQRGYAGSRLMEVVKAEQIGWHVSRTWTGTRNQERAWKVNGNAHRCPTCGCRIAQPYAVLPPAWALPAAQPAERISEHSITAR